MREASRLKMGYYPCPPEAIANACQYLRAGPRTAILDPCAGEGDAVAQIANTLGVPGDRVWCVELDAARGDECRHETLKDGMNVLSPGAFEHTAISNESFGLVYCNPPFDENIGGTRAELFFFARIPKLLVPGGVCLFVCPEHVASRYDFRKAWNVWFEDVACWRFPPDHRKFNEVFIVGRRRVEREDDFDVPNFRMMYPLQDIIIPDGPGPKVFEKTALTDDELAAAVEDSPLLRFCEAQEAPGLRRPPLALSVGHLALLLSSGQLDGIVCPPGGQPHVVRGTARKHEEVTEETTETDGDVRKTTTVYTERIKLVVRTVDSEGVIRNLE